MKLVLDIFCIIFAVLSVQAQDFYYDESGKTYVIDNWGNRYYSGSQRITNPKIKPTNPKLLDFALNLFKNVDNEGQNMVLAPLSPQILLSALAKQSRGATKSEIVDATGYEDSQDLEQIVSEMLSEPTPRELKIGSGYFVEKNDYNNLKESFWKVERKNDDKIDIRISYKRERSLRPIDVIRMDFQSKQKAKATYQKWVEMRTKGVLKNVEADFDPDTKILLASTVYFKGQWLFNFNSSEKADFTLGSGNKVQVEAMKIRKKFHSGTFDNIEARWAAIPYNSSEAMIIIMPEDGEVLDNVINNLTGKDLKDIIDVIVTPTNNFLNVSLPKFSLKSTVQLREPLIKMGVNKLFTPRSELYIFKDDVPLKIASVLQQSFLEVNEEGSIGASTTSFSAIALTIQPEIKNTDFIVDRPFAVFIVDRKQSVPYFMAKIVDPRD